MTIIDKHFHTTLSDGIKTNQEVIDEIKGQLEKGEKAFIVSTEHDIFNEDLTNLFRKNGIKSTYGTEISAYDNLGKKSLHLTFYTDTISREIKEILDNTRTAKKEKIKGQIDLLEKNGFEINYPDFIKYYTKKGANIENLNSYHIKKYIYNNEENKTKIVNIVNKNNESNNEENKKIDIEKINFIKEFLKPDGRHKSYGYAERERYEPHIEALGEVMTKKEGLFLAHPNFTFKDNFEGFYEFIENYKDTITGIEINSTASKEWVDKITEVCEENNFIITFGSDSHGEIEDEFHGELGSINPHVSEELVEEHHKNFLKKLGK